MISMIDRPELTSQRRWIHDLWAALKLLAESGLTDFQPLHSAKRAIAAEEQAARRPQRLLASKPHSCGPAARIQPVSSRPSGRRHPGRDRLD